MQPNPPAPARGCVVFLVNTAASMAGSHAAAGGGSRLEAARRLIEGVLADLAALAARGALDPAELDIAVVGHGGGDSPLRSLLAGSDEAPFVALRDLPAALRLTGASPGGAAREGLADAVLLLQGWLLGQDHPVRPLLVHCTDEDGLAPGRSMAARLLRHHCVPGGAAMLATCGFSNACPVRVTLPCPAAAVPPAWREAWLSSSRGRTAGGEETHALAINDPSPAPLVRLVRLLARQAEAPPLPWYLSTADPVPCEVRVLWAPREGNSDDEYEDARAVDADAGCAVIADGASQGIFSRRWAQLLTGRFLAESPNLTDSAAVEAWIAAARRQWRQEIRYADLHGLQQNKVDEVGSAATLLGLALHRAAGRLRWRAVALGDSCLFHIRRGQMLTSFPLCRPSDFGVTPDLIPTLRRFCPKVRFVTAEGLGKMEDLYGLATDAVAHYLLKSHAEGHPPDWERLWGMDAARWRDELRRLRQRGEVVNDDATLVLLRVRGPGEGSGGVPRTSDCRHDPHET